MARINCYLALNGNCREAMTFYKECFGGVLSFQTIQESPMAARFPEFMQSRILHSTLIHGDLIIMASDLSGEKEMVQGNSVSLSLTCDNEAQTFQYFESLSEGGEVAHPIHEFFAGLMGNLVDKYGVKWMFYFEKQTMMSELLPG